MSERLPELAKLPAGLVLDNELVALGLDGRPSFPLLSLPILHGRESIPVTLMIFDVLRVEGADAMCLPYQERRALLEALDLNGPTWRTPELFADGEALLEATSALKAVSLTPVDAAVMQRSVEPRTACGPCAPGRRGRFAQALGLPPRGPRPRSPVKWDGFRAPVSTEEGCGCAAAAAGHDRAAARARP
jgi:ATP-dependent DNA ligase